MKTPSPDAVNEVKVPTKVILGCATVLSVPVIPPAELIPPEPTSSLVRVPTEVILGCAMVLSVADTVPVKVAPLET